MERRSFLKALGLAPLAALPLRENSLPDAAWPDDYETWPERYGFIRYSRHAMEHPLFAKWKAAVLKGRRVLHQERRYDVDEEFLFVTGRDIPIKIEGCPACCVDQARWGLLEYWRTDGVFPGS